MNRKALILILFLMYGMMANAQYAVGVKGGFNTSLGFNEQWNFGKTSVVEDATKGFNVGLMLRFGHRLFAEVEALYARENTRRTTGTEVGEQHSKVLYQSINFPVLAGFKIVDRRKFNWHLLAGPTINFNLNKDYSTGEFNAENRMMSVGLDLGTGIDFWFVNLGVRYKLIPQSYNYRDFISRERLNTSPINAFELALAFKFLDKM